MGIKILYFLIMFSMLGWSEIKIQRYSISTYTNIIPATRNIGMLSLSNQDLMENDELYVLRVNFRQYANPYVGSASLLSLENLIIFTDDLELEITGPVLVYPSPMNLRDTAVVSYHLNKPSSLDFHIYDVLGRRVYKRMLAAGMLGTRIGNNILTIYPGTFDDYDVSAGVYFLYIFDENKKIIGKTKFAIVP